jgi:hypothetical protein
MAKIVKTVEIDVKSDLKGTEKNLKKINQNLKDLKKEGKKAFDEKEVDRFNDALEETGKEALTVKQRLAQIEDEMAEIGDVGSTEFQRLAKEAGGLKDRVNNTAKAIDTMAADFPGLQVGTQAFQAIGGAAQGAMGATALLGGQNEELEKSIQQLMAITAVMNSVDAVSNALSDETALGLKARVFWGKIQRKEGQKYTLGVIRQTIAQGGLNAAQSIGATGMKILNGIMAINPVFLLIAGFAALAAGIAWFASRTESAAAENDKLNASFDASLNKMKDKAEWEKIRSDERLREISAETSKVIALRKAEQDEELATMVDGTQKKKDLQKKFSDELYKMQLESNQENLQVQGVQAENDERARRNEIDLNKRNIKTKIRLYKKARKNEETELATEIRKEREALQTRNKELIKLNQEYHTKKQELESEGYVLLADQRSRDAEQEARDLQERVQRWKAYKQLLADTDKTIKDKENALIEDDVARQEAIALTKRDRDLAAVKGSKEQQVKLKILIEAEYQAKLKAIHEKEEKQTETHEDKLKDIKQKAADDWAMEAEQIQELATRAGKTAKEIELLELDEYYFELLNKAEQHEINTAALREQYAKKTQDINEKYKEEDEASEDELLEKKFDMVEKSFSAIGGLAAAFAGESEASQRKAFKIQKAASLGEAITNTAKGVTLALTKKNPIPGANLLEAGITAATGAASIATIAKTKFGGGATPPPSVSAPPSSSGSNVANFNVVGNTGVNQLAETLSGQDQKPIQAYVIGSEVTTQQGLDMSIVQTATL